MRLKKNFAIRIENKTFYKTLSQLQNLPSWNLFIDLFAKQARFKTEILLLNFCKLQNYILNRKRRLSKTSDFVCSLCWQKSRKGRLNRPSYQCPDRARQVLSHFNTKAWRRIRWRCCFQAWFVTLTTQFPTPRKVTHQQSPKSRKFYQNKNDCK